MLLGLQLQLSCYLTFRFSRKNMILAALWFSEQKPTMSTLLGPVMEELNDLLINGMNCACVWQVI